MTEMQRIVDQLRRVQEGGAWFGSSLSELLEGLEAADAAARPVPGAHSIWEIVLHITVWEDAVRRRLGGETVQPTDAEDWPEAGDPSTARWRASLATLADGHRWLREAMLGFPAQRFEEARTKEGGTWYQMLHGVMEHDLYHSGQIGLLKRALAGERR
jgi:uncharacterized damage-inducible protein DinB